MSITTWKDAPFFVTVEVYPPTSDESNWLGWFSDILPAEIQDALNELAPDALDDDAVYEIEIDCTSSGYSDPGCTHGEPEMCYPPESEDERIVVGAMLYRGGKPLGYMSKLQVIARLTTIYYDEIEAAEVGV